jgi:hypothetical protein
MKLTISSAYQTLLRWQPVATPTLLGLHKFGGTVLALRVDDLFSFRRQDIVITTRPVGYQGKEGTWMVAVVFRITGLPTAPLEGAAYINPRREDNFRLLQHLGTQEQLPFLFLRPQLKIAIRQEAQWTVHHRQELRLVLAQIGHSPGNQNSTDEEERTFECVRQEFVRLYPVKNLLAFRPSRDAQVSSSFQGVVLE